ncbi:MAG: hypothetical protein GX075_01740 [Firmicutes bacterium]|nr:hypothetical protein [Bacillota bacterium]
MNDKKTFLITIALILICCAVFIGIKLTGEDQKAAVDISATDTEITIPEKTFKILHIMSYHSPWEWTDTLYGGFKDALEDFKIEYRVFQMDTKRFSSEAEKQQKGREARALIDSWKPDLIYTTDDDAQIYVGEYYNNTDLLHVFSAVNEAPEVYHYDQAANVAGVLEIEHFVESVKLLKQIVPDVKKIAAVFDDSPMWIPVMARMKAKLDQVPEVEFVAWDTILTFEEYKEKMREYHSTVDAVALIGIFGFKDANGQNVPYQEVLKWTAANSRLPDFSFWKDRASFGTLCVVSVSGYEQGQAAGKIARQILAGVKKPSEFEMKPTTKGEPIINLARAKKLGINVKSDVLLSVQVINTFEWEK